MYCSVLCIQVEMARFGEKGALFSHWVRSGQHIENKDISEDWSLDSFFLSFSFCLFLSLFLSLSLSMNEGTS